MISILAPAKLTLSLEITGVRSDGYHLLKAEMVSVSLMDKLEISEGEGISVTHQYPNQPWKFPNDNSVVPLRI